MRPQLKRDPRTDPKIGDEISQHRSGYRLRVTKVDGGTISWQRRGMRGRWVDDNSWTLSGWANIVAKNATVIRVAA